MPSWTEMDLSWISAQQVAPAQNGGLWGNLLDWITSRGTAGSAIVAAIVALGLFFLARVAELIQRQVDKRATRRRAVVGLFTEVRANVREVEEFLETTSFPAAAREKIKVDKEFRPLIIMTESTQFYDAVIASLPDITPASLIALSPVLRPGARNESFCGSVYQLSVPHHQRRRPDAPARQAVGKL
jgi:hypothetical protein